MALIDTDTPKSTSGFFMKASNFFSYIPFVGGGLSLVAGAIGTIANSAQWLFRGEISSAVTAAASGTAQTLTNTASGSGIFWFPNVIAGLTTGQSLGANAANLAEGAIGVVGKPLGIRPTVIASYPAGIGGIGGGQVAPMAGPGYWATRAAQERGQDPNARYNQYRRGAGADHVAALEAARAQQQGAYQGI